MIRFRRSRFAEDDGERVGKGEKTRKPHVGWVKQHFLALFLFVCVYSVCNRYVTIRCIHITAPVRLSFYSKKPINEFYGTKNRKNEPISKQKRSGQSFFF